MIPLPILLLCYCIYGIIESFQYSYGSLYLPIYIMPMIYILPIFCALIAKEFKKKRYLKTYITGCKKLDNIVSISDNNKDTKLIQLENKSEFCGMCGKKKNSKMIYCPDCGNKL
ncbi:MAG: hypothetical protein JXA99_07890 [Candidatus Lokiarchaeota archaeon]|nr:hypothetical protein [Candidatus Lokiarchaeota archaeon]